MKDELNMMKKLIPDYYFDSIFDVDIDELEKLGVKGLIIDIDNTLVPYEIAEPTSEVREWLDKIVKRGLQIALVSNNNLSRVTIFNNTLGHYAFHSSKKPLKKSCKKAMEAMKTIPENTVIIGDQIFTDIFVGRRCKLKLAILVKPIKSRSGPFTKVKRILEKPIINGYNKRHKK